ncbi:MULTISPECIES: cation:proton antiporter [Chryseobacterium]|uniref:CPA1 family monovalent cation:H+ antiporter n=1 Tax=Chryseobacterium camelliae TaxID=1265445 RepID=A0ABU0TM31_9FLAO|nr:MULTISPECIES: sodium:proton antiporter [Chryseobacterium]MDT3408033.1 CPA1 family monovalent cation:H+ antiporter [Pseudacidovorax intermedius]MDQ1098112.1 CPA1 family monovalent cation:H+ antiporter [Chryseobacterium camelliae]MDQ1102042.1 CPA1 family monovalent cation:H+ antiporter [Chryseobacterium sp. SORGH_AS_1048]MDR6085478.1 CPA1 family monovalent cation:H+ antiporter [Chryseobacterium sp. SORGH_AS_0909]MDR6129842.1 CPA1 family monovalent cation:H+ antiporter [Chryseobacterium sp. SO
MELYYSFSALIVLASIFAYLNYRFLKLPSTIGIMVIAIVVSIFLVLFGETFLPRTFGHLNDLMNSIDFTEVLMGAMLNFLLFAGGIHINIDDLKEQFRPVVIFSTAGVVISTFVVGFGTYYLLPLVGIELPLIYCLVFGALISPTDPVAVLSILKQANVSKSLETKVAGESLFNDGMAVVVFTVILQLAIGQEVDLSLESIGMLLLKEAGGGLLLGVVLGWVTSRLMREVDDYIISVLVTLSVVMGGYLIARQMHISGPLTMVAAGLFMGNFNTKFNMKSITQDYLIKFWELIDEILNAVLFLFIGFELLMIKDLKYFMIPGLISIIVVLLARFISIWVPTKFMSLRTRFNPQTVKVLVWGGIRGGVSIALALSIPKNEYSNTILSITYCVVVFSIVVQGLTIAKVANPKKIVSEEKEAVIIDEN